MPSGTVCCPISSTSRSNELLEKSPEPFYKDLYGSPAKTFVKRAAYCTDNGKSGGIEQRKVLKSFGVVLVAMGFSGNALQLLAVSLAVIVLHLGVKTICEEE